MKLKLKPAAILLLGLASAQVGAKDVKELKTDKERVSYAIGVNIVRNFKKDQIDFDPNMVIKGLKDAMAGDRLLLGEKDLQKVMNDFQAEVRRKMVANQREAAGLNKKKGDDFLAENKNKEGVATLPSGVQYKILQAG